MGLFKFIGSLLKVGAEDAVDTADWNKLIDWVSLHRSVTTTPYTTVAEDAFLTFNVASGTCNLISASDASIQAGKFYGIKNIHATSLTVDPSGAQTIDGTATVTLAQNESLFIYTNGSNWFKLTAAAGSGETNLMANVGAGIGLIWRDKTGVTFNLKSLVAGGGISITNNADDITVAASGSGGIVTDFTDYAEVASPATPSANIARLFAIDRNARTVMAYKNSLGRTLYLTAERTHALAVPWIVRPGGNASGGIMAFLPVSVSTGIGGTQTIVNVAATVDGGRKRFSTTTTAPTGAGFSSQIQITTRTNNPRFEVKFQLSSLTNIRFWCGLFESDPLGASTSATNEKVALRLASDAANANFCIVTADGVTEQAPIQVAVADTGIHTIFLEMDNPNSRIVYSFDGAAVTANTTNLPSATTPLWLYVAARNLAAENKDLDFWYLDGASDE